MGLNPNLNLANLALNVQLNTASVQKGLNNLVGITQQTGNQIQSSMNGAGQAVQQTAQHTEKLTNNLNLGGKAAGVLGNVLKGVAVGIGIGAWLDFTRVVTNLTEILPHLINESLDFATKAAKISAQTGSTAQQASRLLGMFGFLNISTGNLAFRIGFLDRNLIAHEKLLKMLGITIRDVHGNYVDTLTIMDRVRSALAGVTNGATKSAIEMRLLGRTASDMGLYFNLSDAQVKVLNAEFDKLGITMNRTTVVQALMARTELNLLNLAFEGLGNRIISLVAPALIRGVDALVTFVQKNGVAIAQFAANVVNFILGIISSLTGATFETVNFSDALLAAGASALGAGDSIDNLSGLTHGVGENAKTADRHIQDLIRTITRQIAVVKALEKQQHSEYANTMKGLMDQIKAQMTLLDIEEKRRQETAERHRLEEGIQQAQQRLAQALAGNASGVNQLDVADAQAGLIDAQQALVDFEADIKDHARQDELQKVQDFLDHLMDLEKNSSNKKQALSEVDAQIAILQAQIAAAKQAGDLQLVADLTIELEAAKATAVRLSQEKQNKAREDSLTKEKQHLQDLATKARSTALGIGQVFTDGSNKAGGSLFNLGKNGSKSVQGISDALHGKDGKGGIVGGFSDAEKAGRKFGDNMKTAISDLLVVLGQVGDALRLIKQAIDKLVDAIPGLIRKIQELGKPLGDLLDQLSQALGQGTPATTVTNVWTNPDGSVKRYRTADGVLHQGALPPGMHYTSATEQYNPDTHESGGLIPAHGWGSVGEKGREVIHNPGDTPLAVSPSSGLGGSMTVNIYTTYFGGSKLEAARFAQQFWVELETEGKRRGKVFAGARG